MLPGNSRAILLASATPQEDDRLAQLLSDLRDLSGHGSSGLPAVYTGDGISVTQEGEGAKARCLKTSRRTSFLQGNMETVVQLLYKRYRQQPHNFRDVEETHATLGIRGHGANGRGGV